MPMHPFVYVLMIVQVKRRSLMSYATFPYCVQSPTSNSVQCYIVFRGCGANGDYVQSSSKIWYVF